MMLVSHKNITDFLSTQPPSPIESVNEESLSLTIPDSWTQIGTLKDERLQPTYFSYKLWTHYALGFYPFNDCDIFRDDDGRVLLSYVEYGSHAPFRRSFIAGSNAPTIEDPVGFKCWIGQNNHEEFLKHIARKGFTGKRITHDLQKFEDARQLTDKLTPEEWHLLRRNTSTYENKITYTFVAPREQALQLSDKWGNEPGK